MKDPSIQTPVRFSRVLARVDMREPKSVVDMWTPIREYMRIHCSGLRSDTLSAFVLAAPTVVVHIGNTPPVFRQSHWVSSRHNAGEIENSSMPKASNFDIIYVSVAWLMANEPVVYADLMAAVLLGKETIVDHPFVPSRYDYFLVAP